MRECTKEEVKELAAKLISLGDAGEVGDTLDLLCQVVDAGIDFELRWRKPETCNDDH